MSNPENSVNGNSEIPETASNSPDTILNVTGVTQDYFAGMTRGRIEERERIIKLLEDEELHTHPNNTMANYDKLIWEGIKEELIELIKGEQK